MAVMSFSAEKNACAADLAVRTMRATKSGRRFRSKN